MNKTEAARCLEILDAIRAFYKVYEFSPSYTYLKNMTGLHTSSFEHYLADLDRSGDILRTKLNGRRTNIKLLKHGKPSYEMVRKARELRVDVLRGRKFEIAAAKAKPQKSTLEERMQKIVQNAQYKDSAGVDVLCDPRRGLSPNFSMKCTRIG